MKVAICDDNQIERDFYSEKLVSVAKKTGVQIQIASYENGKQMLFELDDPEAMPDVLYLDVNMPDMSGVEVAEILRKKEYSGEIIFLTQSESHWQSAFDIHAYQYIVKDNCSDDKFESVFLDVTKSIREKNEEHILFTNCGDIISVPIKSIKFFEVTNRIVTVYYETGSFEFYSTLAKLEEQLINRDFIRIHKSYLVSILHISMVTYKEVIMNDNKRLPIGRAYQKNIKQVFGDGKDA